MAAPPGGGGRLQATLHSAVQSIRWTYTIFWQLCPRQGALVWGDGYYNGEIKTRKTVQSMEVSAEEASLQRSQQLRELYDSLSAGETNQPPPKRPCAALSPEDLTETEWFYLMCVSFSFAPGVGIPGKAYAKRQHVWLGGANEQDSKVFTRAILAKSARIQTVLCIPVAGGIVEFGSTELIKEDKTLVQHLKTYFPVNMNPRQPPPKPALSEQSTSNPVPATSSDSHYRHLLHSSSLPAIFSSASQLPTSSNNNTDTNDPSRVNKEEDEDEAEGEPGSEAEIETRNVPAAEPKSDLMQVETSEDIRLGSPDDASNNLGPEFPSVGPSLVRTDLATRPSSVQEVRGPVQPALFSGAAELEELTEEDAHYSRTVSVLLQHQSAKWPDAVNGYIFCSSQSAFAKWTSLSDSLHHFNEPTGKTSSQQGFLKYILLSVPFLHSTNRDEGSSKARPEARDSSSFDRFKKGAFGQEEAGVNHVMAERRRREKLNEKFIILRSLVPFVTKMDKASILADTIEYVKQLRKKIAELEEKKSRQNEVVQLQRPRTESPPPCTAASISDVGRRGSNGGNGPRGKKMRAVEEIAPKPVAKVVEPLQKDVQVQVSIIECDALVEIQCRYREGLLLDVMVALRELGIETTAVQSFVKYGKFEGEVRAKVKRDKVSSGKKVTIAEVKRAIYQIIPLEA